MIRNSLRERYEKKRKERQDILGTGGLPEVAEEKKSANLSEGNENLCRVKIQFDKKKIFSIFRH